MGKINTKELMDEYFAQVDPVRAKRNRGHVDRAEVYEYEQKIGKDLIDMDADELIQMVKTFGNSKVNVDGLGMYGSYKQIATIFRDMWNYYIDHYEIIKNPWYDKKLRGLKAYEQLADGADKLTFDKLQDAIDTVYGDYASGYYLPMYVELIILLFYCGFANTKEIVSMKRDMVDFETNTVTLPDKQVHLSKRCVNLLEHFYNMKDVEGHTGLYYVVPWHDSYIRFFVRKSKVSDFQDRSLEEVCSMIVRTMTAQLRQRHNINLNYRRIYNLGFYDYLVNRYGKEKATQIIKSVRTPEDTALLREAASDYGLYNQNMTILKGDLLQFV